MAPISILTKKCQPPECSRAWEGSARVGRTNVCTQQVRSICTAPGGCRCNAECQTASASEGLIGNVTTGDGGCVVALGFLTAVRKRVACWHRV